MNSCYFSASLRLQNHLLRKTRVYAAFQNSYQYLTLFESLTLILNKMLNINFNVCSLTGTKIKYNEKIEFNRFHLLLYSLFLILIHFLEKRNF